MFAVGEDSETSQGFAHEVESFLEEAGQAATVRPIVLRGAEDLSDAILDAAPGTLVLDRLGRTVKSIDVVSLLAQSSGSLLLRN